MYEFQLKTKVIKKFIKQETEKYDSDLVPIQSVDWFLMRTISIAPSAYPHLKSLTSVSSIFGIIIWKKKDKVMIKTKHQNMKEGYCMSG